MIHISVMNSSGEVLKESVHPVEAMVCVDRIWEKGDTILFLTPAGAHLQIAVDASMLQGEVYLPDGIMHWAVPFGEHRLAYMPGLFEGKRHIITARLLSEQETAVCRDLARNPLDLRAETDFFPHCTANVETRNESVFAARNVIDGLRFNLSHGEWPYESWGIGAREDAWCLLDFGREVIVDQMALTLRADFPHDAYWVSGHVADSNGDELAFHLHKTGERQIIDLGGRCVRWLRLENMIKSDDPSAFPSLRAWEVYGYDQVDPVEKGCFRSGELMSILNEDTFQEVLSHHNPGQDPTFSQAVYEMMVNKELTSKEMIVLTGMEHSYFYHILNGTRHPGRNMVLRIGFCLGASLSEMNRLLKLAGFSELYSKKDGTMC